MIGHFPLWIILAIWMLQKNHPPKLSPYNYQRQARLIEDMRGSLPIPTSKLDIWLVTQILTWLDRENDALMTMRLMGVVAAVAVKR